MGSRTELDRLARDLATGEISRRSALARLVAGAVAVGVASLPGAEALASRSKKCPKSRRCGEKCCPKHAKCKHGKCKCVSGYTKCGKKCVDLQTSATNCGGCGTVCAAGEGCFSGQCVTPNNCGNSQIDPGEVCDGNDLGGETCVSQGFLGGTLACNPNCMQFVYSGCTAPQCDGPEDCPVAAVGSCQQAVCSGGTCDFAPDDSNLPEDNNPCTANTCSGGVPSNPPLPQDTSCSQGGSFCDGAGNCVECNSASQCPATGNPCVLRTCQSHTCGTQNADGSVQCSAATCTGALLTPPGTCNGAGGCFQSSATSCSPYRCNDAGTACLQSCNTASDCISGNYSCDAGVCKKLNGQLCSSASECHSGFCVDGVCCDSACTTKCKQCARGGFFGTCTNAAVGTDPHNDCAQDASHNGFCDGAGTCAPA